MKQEKEKRFEKVIEDEGMQTIPTFILLFMQQVSMVIFFFAYIYKWEVTIIISAFFFIVFELIWLALLQGYFNDRKVYWKEIKDEK